MKRLLVITAVAAAMTLGVALHHPKTGSAAVLDLPLLTGNACTLVCYDAGAIGCPNGQHDAFDGSECAFFPTHGGTPHPGDCNSPIACRTGTCEALHQCSGFADAEFEVLRNRLVAKDIQKVREALSEFRKHV